MAYLWRKSNFKKSKKRWNRCK